MFYPSNLAELDEASLTKIKTTNKCDVNLTNKLSLSCVSKLRIILKVTHVLPYRITQLKYFSVTGYYAKSVSEITLKVVFRDFTAIIYIFIQKSCTVLVLVEVR